MNIKHVWISEKLYDEIIFLKQWIEENEKVRGKKIKITNIEASDRMAQKLKELRYKKQNK